MGLGLEARLGQTLIVRHFESSPATLGWRDFLFWSATVPGRSEARPPQRQRIIPTPCIIPALLRPGTAALREIHLLFHRIALPQPFEGFGQGLVRAGPSTWPALRA